ncbi:MULTISPECIES: TonB-dependent receptor [unclassified Rhodanobacter]|uniref:TonB-dependent receptor n=1 Tax=unclassified Rhodanobacter TaxID=2621553 RepID=UPI001BDE4D99|nr:MULTISPECIES: TonB-dependent receptor [unclassified Rhodanobacter]MBT2143315.1 TonB-dependent receptor [Rhodanobacter sp. LX-99]MBT2147611.1 TonB-dependent receptor [Rhodanobacter sp. LX-100]
MNALPLGLCAIALAVAGHPLLAADEPAPATTTLAPVSVHASDTMVMETPSVQVRVARQKLQQQNVTESADALKYAPNMQVRKRYIGDPNAVISGRNAGTLQSARSLVYADGLLLSNLMTNGWDGAPRWGMVAPEEIGAVDIQYGPYSALYPGNSLGGTVLIHTVLPQQLTASVSTQFFSQDYRDAYGAGGHYNGHQAAATLGDKQGRFSWLLEFSRLDNRGQPMQYATAKAGGDAAAAVPVSGAVLDRNPNGSPRLVYGANSIEHTVQDQAKLKVGVDINEQVAALFTVGWWHNRAEDRTRSLIRDAAGNPVAGGVISAGGQTWTLPASGLAPSSANDIHLLYGIELNGRLDNGWRWTAVASHYDFQRSQAATANLAEPGAPSGGPGTIADKAGSGWDTFDLRSSGPLGDRHMLYAGVHGDRYVLDSRVRNASDWRGDADGAQVSAFAGRTQTRALYLQDVWSFADAWALTLGGRLEQWRAYGGLRANATDTLRYADRKRTDFSPKAALSWDLADGWELRLAHGKAVRYPTVTELFQGSLSANAIVNNNPDLKPETDESTDLTLTRHLDHGHWRVSLYQDRIADSLYSQTDITVTPTVTSVQNIDQMRSRGIEGEINLTDLWLDGLDLQASLAYNHAKTLQDRQYPLANGKTFPRIPKIRASVFADYRFAPRWDASLGIRHSGRQYGTLDNSDYVDSYGAVSRFTVADAKLRWKFSPGWTAALGVDNLTNERYWVYHPYAGRTWFGELRWEL